VSGHCIQKIVVVQETLEFLLQVGAELSARLHHFRDEFRTPIYDPNNVFDVGTCQEVTFAAPFEGFELGGDEVRATQDLNAHLSTGINGASVSDAVCIPAI
jgi:hypothetical protein